MNALVPKTAEVDPKRKAMMAAAEAYDDLQRELGSIKDQLHTAVAGLEAKNSEIVELRKMLEHQRTEFNKMLTEERLNVQIANQARDKAYEERADALAWLSAVEAVIERAREGGLPPVRRKRNGRHVADDSGPGNEADASGRSLPNEAGGGA